MTKDELRKQLRTILNKRAMADGSEEDTAAAQLRMDNQLAEQAGAMPMEEMGEPDEESMDGSEGMEMPEGGQDAVGGDIYVPTTVSEKFMAALTLLLQIADELELDDQVEEAVDQQF